MDTADLIKAFGAFFAIMNPFVNLPIFLALTEGFDVRKQRILATKVAIFSAIMCAIILVAGSTIIGFFGITVDQFRIAGGAVLAHVAWSMLNGRGIDSHHGSEAEKGGMQDLSGLAFYPITFPMIVGPGTIATLIIYSGNASGVVELVEIGAVAGVILLALYVVLFFAASFDKILTDTARVIMTRLMGMILLAIAVEMMAAGLTAVMPGLA